MILCLALKWIISLLPNAFLLLAVQNDRKLESQATYYICSKIICFSCAGAYCLADKIKLNKSESNGFDKDSAGECENYLVGPGAPSYPCLTFNSHHLLPPFLQKSIQDNIICLKCFLLDSRIFLKIWKHPTVSKMSLHQHHLCIFPQWSKEKSGQGDRERVEEYAKVKGDAILLLPPNYSWDPVIGQWKKTTLPNPWNFTHHLLVMKWQWRLRCEQVIFITRNSMIRKWNCAH